MSRRTMLYRKSIGKTASETASNIVARHGTAHDKYGEVCSRPMKAAKVARLAGALHK